VFAVASPYSWDLVESAHRLSLDVICIDNIGGADKRLPLAEGRIEPEPFVIGLASADGRAEAAYAANRAGYSEPRTLVDPSAVIASTATLRHGMYVNAGVVVGSFADLGCHGNVNRSASIGHNTELGFAVSVGPGAVLSGSVRVGARAFIGSGVTILPEISIGRRAVVGAGAVVTRNVAPGEVVVGNPATVLRRQDLDQPEDSCPHCSSR